MKRIGILGGTFNPIHMGHLIIAQTAQERLSLDRVVFVPCAEPPLKRMRNMAPDRDRYRITQLAVSTNPRFEVSDFEIRNGGKSYSIDTIRYFRKKYPKTTKLFFIIGGDGLIHLHRWKNIKELLKLVSFIVVNRPGFPLKKGKIPFHSVPMPGIGISASDLRRRVKNQQSIQYFVPDSVIKYIQKNKLYRV